MITPAFCVNTNGSDYIKPLVIGESANPRCFRDVNKDAYVQYSLNQNKGVDGRLPVL